MFQNFSELEQESVSVEQERSRSLKNVTPLISGSNAPQETATDCGYVGLQANVSVFGLLANKYIRLNHEWNITGITQ